MRRPAAGRAAPRALPRALALLASAAWLLASAAAAASVAVVVAVHGGRDLVLLDGRLRDAGRVALSAPAIALATDGAGGTFAALEDGRVVRIDPSQAAIAASTQVGEALSALAMTSDGRYVAVAVARPAAIVVLRLDLATERHLPARDADGRRPAPPVALADHPARRSVLVALPAIAEVWELSYDDDAAPIHPGLVHDFRLGEGIAVPGKLNARRAPVDPPVTALLAGPSAHVVAGTAPTGAVVLNLDVRRPVARLAPDADVRAGARWPGTLALPADRVLRFYDEGTWRAAAAVALGGQVRLVRADPASPYAWAVVRDDAAGERLVRIDKASRAPSGTWPLPDGVSVAALAFDARGWPLVLGSGTPGALWLLDADALAPVAQAALEAPGLLVPTHQRAVSSK